MTEPSDSSDTVEVPAVATNDSGETLATIQAPATEQENVTSTPSAPPSQDAVKAFWNGIDAELAAIPAAPELEEKPLYSTEFATTWKVRLTSIGPYRIAAYLSIPHGDGPFPALLSVPGYGSVVTPPQYEDRQRYAVLTLMYRGTRHADWPYAGKFPGVLTDGIADPQTWIYRGILADHLRGLEFLRDRPEVDTSRIGLIGNDIGLLIAARRPEITAVAVGSSFFHRPAGSRRCHRGVPVRGDQRLPADVSSRPRGGRADPRAGRSRASGERDHGKSPVHRWR